MEEEKNKQNPNLEFNFFGYLNINNSLLTVMHNIKIKAVNYWVKY